MSLAQVATTGDDISANISDVTRQARPSLALGVSNVRAYSLYRSRHGSFRDASNILDDQSGIERNDAIGAYPTRCGQRSGQHI